MERLQMCRMCLVEDAPMYVVVNRNMHEIYEKLTNKTFVTEDRRPMLVCYFCCSKLKQCCRFQKKCLEAEELFAQMLEEVYKLNPFINPDVLELNNGFVKSPIELISIVGECHIDNHAIKEELPADCERQANIIEPKEELQFDDLEREIAECSENSVVEDIPVLHSDSEDEVPLAEIKTEVEEEQETNYLERENAECSENSDVEDIPVLPSDSEDEVPLAEIKTEVEEEQETNWAPVAKIPKLHIRRTKLEELITEEPKKNERLGSKIIRTNSAKRNLQFKEPLTYTRLRADNTINNSSSIINNCLDTNFCNTSNSAKDDFGCKISNKDMESDGVNIHQRLRIKEKRYKCEVCQYSCNQKWTLTRHIRTHTHEKPYKCEVCQYSCNQKSDLIKHISIHNNKKLYECEVCQYSCNVKTYLTLHIRMHTREKPYKCELCQYSSNIKGDLNRHIRIHTGEKPYICEVCQHSCNIKSNLTKHIRKHHTGKNT